MSLCKDEITLASVYDGTALEKADDAAKTATDYIGADASQTEFNIGPSSGSHVHIDTDSVDIIPNTSGVPTVSMSNEGVSVNSWTSEEEQKGLTYEYGYLGEGCLMLGTRADSTEDDLSNIIIDGLQVRTKTKNESSFQQAATINDGGEITFNNAATSLINALTTPTFTQDGMGIVSSRVTINSGGYCKVGKLVLVKLYLTTKTSFSANNYYGILTGLPAMASGDNGMFQAGSDASWNYTRGAFVGSNGYLYFQTGGGAVASGKSIYITGIYFSA